MRIRALIAALAVAALAAAVFFIRERFFPPQMPVETLIVQTVNGAAKFTVEVARSGPEHERGLMFRKTLAPDAGMLFVFGGDRPLAFWMKNTLIALDILFIRSDGVIVRIARNARPMSETPIPSGRPVRAVLEIPGGRAAALQIRPGDKIQSGWLSR